MKDYTHYLIILIILVVFVLFNNIFKVDKTLENFNASNELFEVSRPFVNLYDNKGNMLNIVLVSRPFYLDSHYEDYKKIKDRFMILGISSYQEFPNQPRNPKDNYSHQNIYDSIKYTNMCEGWLHCFRNKDEYIPRNMKSLLLSESDFTDCNVHVSNKNKEKKYDFIYVCHRDDLGDCSSNEWVAYNKNLSLANECFELMCSKYNYKGLLVGRSGCKLPKKCANKLETTPKLDYKDLKDKYDEAKFIFLPNIHDASPRVLTEALCHDIPVLVNKNIVGGWKYVTPETGEFFNNISDFEETLNKLMNNINNNSYQPRKHFVDNYGIKKSGKHLKEFVGEVFNTRLNIPLEEIDYITPDYKKIDYNECLA